MYAFGLVGRSLGHSFSQAYFTAKFTALGLPYTYALFELENLDNLAAWLAERPALRGLNITIPYKTEILQFADRVEASAQLAGAANTLAKQPDGSWTAHNTDTEGFKEALTAWMAALGRPQPAAAAVLGTGGASKGVQVALSQLGISHRVFGRTDGFDLNGLPILPYPALDDAPLAELWVQTTPVGQYPDSKAALPLPYHRLGAGNLAFDLVYNPPTTAFMAKCLAQGVHVQNGLAMLLAQAEAAWRIWQQTGL
jgi:shikimate dehydrogenase